MLFSNPLSNISESTPVSESDLHVNSLNYDNYMSNELDSNNVLLLVERVQSKHSNLNLFWDTGSSVSLASKSYVNKNKLKGVEICFDLVTVGGNVEKHTTFLHTIEIIDKDGLSYFVKACEIDNICGYLKKFNVPQSIIDSFEDLSHCEISRPYGNIDLLIGIPYADLFPIQVQEVKGLVLYDSKFGLLGGGE